MCSDDWKIPHLVKYGSNVSFLIIVFKKQHLFGNTVIANLQCVYLRVSTVSFLKPGHMEDECRPRRLCWRKLRRVELEVHSPLVSREGRSTQGCGLFSYVVLTDWLSRRCLHGKETVYLHCSPHKDIMGNQENSASLTCCVTCCIPLGTDQATFLKASWEHIYLKKIQEDKHVERKISNQFLW